jgi:hypothetical protein
MTGNWKGKLTNKRKQQIKDLAWFNKYRKTQSSFFLADGGLHSKESFDSPRNAIILENLREERQELESVRKN